MRRGKRTSDRLPGAPVALRPYFSGFRVTRRFMLEGRLYEEGTLLGDNEVARKLCAEYPNFLQPASR
jgi:hypothetical protein